MDNLEPKKLALLRILQILQKESDAEHPLKQEEIVSLLDRDYGIVIERKAVGRNLSLLREAGMEIESDRRGSYLAGRMFEEAELRLLIDGVLASRHISARHSGELIDKLCGLTSRHFRRHIRHVYSAGEWNRTNYQTLFYYIELLDEAIETERKVRYDYNKYGTDRQLHKSSSQEISPYQLVLHNQRYYLMGYSEKYGSMVFHRLDRISEMKITTNPEKPLREIKGYENGIDYRRLSTALPYMYTDEPVPVTFVARCDAADQIVDWFGQNIRIEALGEKCRVTVTVSPNAMLYWAMQYADCITIVSPSNLRQRVADVLREAVRNYENGES